MSGRGSRSEPTGGRGRSGWKGDRPPPPWAEWVTGEAATGYSISLLLHIAFLLALSLTFIDSLSSDPPLSVFLTSWRTEEAVDEHGALVDTVIHLTRESRQAVVPESISLRASESVTREVPTAPPEKKEDVASPENGDGERVVPAGEEDLPENAVRAGSFAAWWIPKAERYGEVIAPGQLPRVGQEYRIILQIRLPAERRIFNVHDLSGEIIGSDGYRQFIPDRAWTVDEKGELVRVSSPGSLPVREGLVQIAFKVQGAGRAGVRDEIRIQSRLLNETQTLVLTFQPKP